MNLLALDLSLSTGWALFSEKNLKEYGLLKIKETTEQFGPYPYGVLLAAEKMGAMVRTLVLEKVPDFIIIENTNLGRNRNSQRVLEFIHCCVLQNLQEVCQVEYMDSSEWRKILKVGLSKEDREKNKALSKAKAKAEKEGVKLDKKALGVNGKITQKHVAIRWINEKHELGFLPKDDDVADAICLGEAYLEKTGKKTR